MFDVSYNRAGQADRSGTENADVLLFLFLKLNDLWYIVKVKIK